MTDREWDAAIAERLFGLNVVESHGQLVVKRTIGCSENAPEVPIWVAESIPDYAIWEGAGLIVEAMEAKGYHLALVRYSGQSWDGWYAKFAPKDIHIDSAPWQAVKVDDPCEAVRLAALRALGVSGEEDRGS